MFVYPPPPPRYAPSVAYAAGASNGMPVAIVETTNVVKHPEGGCPLQVGEGTYELREDLQLATPPPHPSEAPVVNLNPLSTSVPPPTSGVKLSMVIVQPRRNQLQPFRLKSTTSDLRSIKEAEEEQRNSSENGTSNFGGSATPVFGEWNPALASTPMKGDGPGIKRRKPKGNIVKSSSSFVSRVIVNEAATKKLGERNPEGLYVFANINRAFQWLDFDGKSKHDPISKVLFTKAHVLAHDVNEVTKSATHLDVIMGTSAADIIWYEPMQQKYARINKNGTINSTPIKHIKWLPGSENYFMVAHADGSLVIYDKEKEDGTFNPEEPEDDSDKNTAEARRQSPFKVLKSVNSKNQRANPVAYWKLSNYAINNFAFSPDRRHLAVVLEDGSLRLMDFLKEQMLDVFPSYYGGLICVCWSPDGKYILTGGQDDLVSIWSLEDRNIVARCQGHSSWVTCVAFDPWRCDERTYRFGSVGDDCRLLLWDFSVAMLHRPKLVQATVRNRNSISTITGQSARHRAESLSTGRVRSDSNKTDKPVEGDGVPVIHPVEPRARTAQLPPILSKVVGDDPICWLGFLEDSIMTSSLEGHIRTWNRPQESTNEASSVASRPTTTADE